MPLPRTEAGFTLIEVLVAFIIAALAIAALLAGSFAGLRAVRTSGQYQEALSRARSHLAGLLVQNLAAGTQTGDDGGGFRWQTQETPLGTIVVPGGTGTGTPILYRLRVTISWGPDDASREVTLQSEKLGSLPARAP